MDGSGDQALCLSRRGPDVRRNLRRGGQGSGRALEESSAQRLAVEVLREAEMVADRYCRISVESGKMTSEDSEHVLCASHPLEHFVINDFS